jgi:hypothetical protein
VPCRGRVSNNGGPKRFCLHEWSFCCALAPQINR